MPVGTGAVREFTDGFAVRNFDEGGFQNVYQSIYFWSAEHDLCSNGRTDYLCHIQLWQEKMRRGKSLTREQKECLFSHCINWNDWLFLEETEFFYHLVNRHNNRTKYVDKFIRPMGGIRNGRKKAEYRRSGEDHKGCLHREPQ